jgi:hypothetical protein
MRWIQRPRTHRIEVLRFSPFLCVLRGPLQRVLTAASPEGPAAPSSNPSPVPKASLGTARAATRNPREAGRAQPAKSPVTTSTNPAAPCAPRTRTARGRWRSARASPDAVPRRTTRSRPGFASTASFSRVETSSTPPISSHSSPFPVLSLFPGPRSTKPGGFWLSGLRGEFLAAMMRFIPSVSRRALEPCRHAACLPARCRTAMRRSAGSIRGRNRSSCLLETPIPH